MPKHTFDETTEVNNKVFFEGEAEISDADLKAIKERQGSNAETTVETDLTKKTKAELLAQAGSKADESMTKAQIIELIEG